MDRAIEEKLVRNFVEKRIQDRVLYELTSNKTDEYAKNFKRYGDLKYYPLRQHAIGRFAHRADDHLKKQHIHLEKKEITIDEVEKEINKLCTPTKQCYIMGTVHDGECMSLRKALEISFDYIGESIVVIRDNIVFLKEEGCFRIPTKYILFKKT